MSREPDYKVEDLSSIVRAWIRTVYELLRRPIANAETSLNAGEVGGKTLAQIRSEVNSEIDEHISAVYPHRPTLSDLFYASSLHQQDFLNTVTINWSLGVISIAAFRIQILGKEHSVPAWSGPMLPGTNFLVIKGSGGIDNRAFNMIVSNRPLSGFLEYTVAALYRSPNSLVTIPLYRMD